MAGVAIKVTVESAFKAFVLLKLAQIAIFGDVSANSPKFFYNRCAAKILDVTWHLDAASLPLGQKVRL